MDYSKFSDYKIFDKGCEARDVITYFNDLIFSAQEKLFFRGYSKDDEIFPKLLRERYFILKDKENELFSDFVCNGSVYFHANSTLEVIANAQHYGLPTNILDFSFSPFVALAFSLNGDLEFNDSYYKILCCKKNRFTYLEEDELEKGDSAFKEGCVYLDKIGKAKTLINDIIRLFSHIRSSNGYKEFVFVNPYIANARILAQRGLFMFCKHAEKEVFMTEICNMKLVKVHRDLRDDLIKYLEIIGCDMFRLMPDLENVCRAIVGKNK